MVTLGIDEVGRGSWAGPLVAGAVILNEPIEGLKDSKQLTKTQRARLAAIINREALAVGIGWVAPAEVDELGLTAAVRLAMERAVAEIKTSYDEIIIDGNFNFLATNPKAKAIVKADATVPVVSAASVVAKVARDNYMSAIAADYPDYGFGRHAGYGTSLHLEKIQLHGVCDQHRHSFKPIQSLLQLAR